MSDGVDDFLGNDFSYRKLPATFLLLLFGYIKGLSWFHHDQSFFYQSHISTLFCLCRFMS